MADRERCARPLAELAPTGRNDSEREQYIERWRDRVLAACHALAAKLSH
jgi:hypothetical protein